MLYQLVRTCATVAEHAIALQNRLFRGGWRVPGIGHAHQYYRLAVCSDLTAVLQQHAVLSRYVCNCIFVLRILFVTDFVRVEIRNKQNL